MKKGKNQSTDKLKRWKYLDRKTDYVLWFQTCLCNIITTMEQFCCMYCHSELCGWQWLDPSAGLGDETLT